MGAVTKVNGEYLRKVAVVQAADKAALLAEATTQQRAPRLVANSPCSSYKARLIMQVLPSINLMTVWCKCHSAVAAQRMQGRNRVCCADNTGKLM